MAREPRTPEASSEHKDVKLADGVLHYSGAGHAPFRGGDVVRVPAEHADELVSAALAEHAKP